jgi:hypothetical protein
MTMFEALCAKGECQGIEVVMDRLPERLKGLYYEDENIKVVTLNCNLETDAERRCKLSEEYGHAIVGGNLISGDLDPIIKSKLEYRARGRGYYEIFSPDELYDGLKENETYYEIAEEFDVTESFVRDAIDYYISKGKIFDLDVY